LIEENSFLEKRNQSLGKEDAVRSIEFQVLSRQHNMERNIETTFFD